MTPAIFGITNSGVNLVVSLLVLSLVAMWIAMIYWTHEDAQRRIEDPMLVWIFTAWSLFPFIGTLIYLIIRPPEFLEDVRERDVETKAAEARLHMLRNRTCGNCGYETEPTYLRCPSCLRKLKEPCESCKKPLDPRWRVCPFCETEVKRVQARPAPSSAQRARAGRAAPERPARTKTPAEEAPSRRAPSGARSRPTAAEAASAAERQRRSLASVSPDEGDESAQRLSASAAIGPKRTSPETGKEAKPEAAPEAEPAEGDAKPRGRSSRGSRKAPSRRKT